MSGSVHWQRLFRSGSGLGTGARTDTGFTELATFLLLISWGFPSRQRPYILAESRRDGFFAQMARGMNLALLGYVVAGQFVTVAHYPYLWIHLALCAAICEAQRSEGRRRWGGAPIARPNITG